LVLMDVQMPVMDGYEAVSIIRRMPGCAELPIVAITAHAMLSDRDKSMDSGMNDFLTKPIVPGKLFITVARWLNPSSKIKE